MPHSPRSEQSEQTHTSVASALLSLAREDKGRSNTARLRDVFAEVQSALEAGVRRQTVLETLNSRGFKLTLKGFESALYRLRKQSRGASTLQDSTGEAAPTLPPRQPAPSPPHGAAFGACESAAGQANDAVREALTNQQSREEKFSRYSGSSPLSTRLGQKKEL